MHDVVMRSRSLRYQAAWAVVTLLVMLVGPAAGACTAGSVKLELASPYPPAAGTSTCKWNAYAKCFSAFTLSLTSACVMTVAPTDTSAKVYVPRYGDALGSRTNMTLCPLAAANSTVLTYALPQATPTTAETLSGLRTLLSASIWRSAPDTIQLSSSWPTVAGMLQFNDNSTGEPCPLQWRAVADTGPGVAGITPAPCPAGTANCVDSSGVASTGLCAAGSRKTAYNTTTGNLFFGVCLCRDLSMRNNLLLSRATLCCIFKVVCAGPEIVLAGVANAWVCSLCRPGAPPQLRNTASVCTN